jgi:diguanylate cyclase (GGDEF)-like protein
MRLGWFVALAASVALIVGGIVDWASTERQLSAQRDERLGTLAALTAATVDGKVDRLASALEVAPADVDPASLAAALGDGVNVCDDADGSSCALAEPIAAADVVAGVRAEARRSGGVAVGASDGDVTDEVLVVAVVRPGGELVAHVPVRALLSLEISRLPAASFGVPRMVRADAANLEPGVATRAGRRVHAVSVPTRFVGGRYLVVASGDRNVTVSSGQRLLVTLMIAAGALGLVISLGVLITTQRRLSRRAVTDELTGLVTRGELLRRGASAVAEANATGCSVAIVFVDLDGFKAVNDLDGHHVGDQLLAAVAVRLRATTREGDVIGRWGGDEFVVLLVGAGREAAARRAGELCAAVAGVSAPSGVNVTASAGVAVFPIDGADVESLVRTADAEMYAMKRRREPTSTSSP